LTHQQPREVSTTILQVRKSTLLITAALIVGALIGFTGSMVFYRHYWIWAPGERPFDRMSRALTLSDVQRGQLRAVLYETKRELNQARFDFETKQRRLMIKAYLRSRALLNPAQQSRFDHKFVPQELLREARESAHEEATASNASAVVPVAPTPTPSAAAPNSLTSRSGA
jgi:hypothetical protein